MFGLHHDLADVRGQDAWRYCTKCGSLFFDGYADKGICAAGGGHTAAGYNFRLYFDQPGQTAPPSQPAPQPGVPRISVSVPQSRTFLVQGSGFLPATTVTIRVADDFLNPNLYFTTTSTPSGTISATLSIPCNPGRLHFTATDGRPNPGDFTGRFWSNTATTNCG
jgi:hypothetical protein